MNPSDLYVNCDSCRRWYHPECVGIKSEIVDSLEEFICVNCKKEGKANKRTKKTFNKLPNPAKDAINKA